MARTIVAAIEGEYRRYQKLGEGALKQLDADALARRPPGEGNSVATIVWHLSGNLKSRFTDFLGSDGEKSWRNREEEFAPRRVTPNEVMAKWQDGWSVLFATLEILGDDDLARTVTIRGVGLSVLDALLRSVTHASYHVGQIVYQAKALRGPGWEWLTIPPGGSAAYNRDPRYEKP
jgi:hypothetical protein